MKPKIQCLFFLGLLSICGCASYAVRPNASSITIPKSPEPIHATVGIVQADQKLSGGFPDLVPVFKKYLEESGLFESVYYPTRSGDHLDAELLLHIRANFRADAALFPKAFLTGFFMFLPAPIVTYNHHYEAQATLDVKQAEHLSKSYVAKISVEASHKLFGSPTALEAEGTEAAAKLLSASLIEQLVSEREALAQWLKPQR